MSNKGEKNVENCLLWAREKNDSTLRPWCERPQRTGARSDRISARKAKVCTFHKFRWHSHNTAKEMNGKSTPYIYQYRT